MKTIYPARVIERANDIVSVIESSGFFEDNEVSNIECAHEKFRELLLGKFITGNLDDGDKLFTNDEMEIILKQIIISDCLITLQEMGLVQSYSDENTEEVFFLTKIGKKTGEIMGLDKK